MEIGDSTFQNLNEMKPCGWVVCDNIGAIILGPSYALAVYTISMVEFGSCIYDSFGAGLFQMVQKYWYQIRFSNSIRVLNFEELL